MHCHSRCKPRREKSQRLSTLKIRVKRRLNIWCHRLSVNFEVGLIAVSLTGQRTKPMRSVRSFIAAGAATLLSQAAFAADMAIMPPPAYAPAPVVEDFGGW